MRGPHQGLSTTPKRALRLPRSMRFLPSYLLLAAFVQAAFLAAYAHTMPIPTITPAEAAMHEGQGTVRLSGLVANVRAAGDSTRLALQADGHRVDAHVPGALHIPEGSWVEATGRLARLSGTLTLLVAGPQAMQATEPPGPAQPSWADLASDPGAWQGKPLLMRGTVASGQLRDSDGHRISIGTGPWPKSGPVEALATISYDRACLCHRLDATDVAPLGAWSAWTP